MATFSEPRGGYRDAAQKTWPDHRGRKVEGARYWMPPPPAVGEVVSAYSNQGPEGFRVPMPLSRRIMGFLLITGMLVVMATMLSLFVAEQLLDLYTYPHQIQFLVALPWIPIMGALVAWLMKPRPICTYVGREGVSEHKKGAFKESHLDLCFEDAEALTTAVTREYRNGVYQGTRYAFAWWGAGRQLLFTFRGSRREPGFAFALEEDPSWDFALAAEAMWSRHRRPRMARELAQNGFLAFRAGPKRYLYVSDEKLEIEHKSGLLSLPREQIAALRVNSGALEIHEVGATEGLLRSRGIHRLSISEIDNYVLLLEALEEHLELRLPGRPARAPEAGGDR